MYVYVILIFKFKLVLIGKFYSFMFKNLEKIVVYVRDVVNGFFV